MYRVQEDWYSLMGRIAKGDTKGAAQARKELRESLIVTSPVFSAKPFFMSDEFSLVDCCVAPLLWRLPALGIAMPPQATAIQEYAKRLFEWPAFRKGLTEAEREMAE